MSCLKWAANKLFSMNLAGSTAPEGGKGGGVTDRVPWLEGVGGGARGGECPKLGRGEGPLGKWGCDAPGCGFKGAVGVGGRLLAWL